MLDENVLNELDTLVPCRGEQAQQLGLLLDPGTANSSSLVVHGTEATGKSLTLQRVLTKLNTPNVTIECRRCITGRHLLEQTVHSTKNALLEAGIPIKADKFDPRCESVSALNVQLQNLLDGVERFILVFDGVDRQREAPPTLLAALGRLSEFITPLTIIMVVTVPRSRFLHNPGIPHVHFQPYGRSDLLEIMSQWTPEIYSTEAIEEQGDAYGPDERAEDNRWLWQRFCGAVWDSIGKGAARDLVNFRNVCERLWPAFVAPIRRREYGTRDFSRLMVRNRIIFQSEAGLHDGLVAPAVLAEADFEGRRRPPKHPHELPYYSKFLLVSAYLASHNPARQDPVFFMKMHEKKRKKKGGGTAKTPNRQPKTRTIQRKLLGPQPFPLERWLAIFHAIVPHDVPSGTADLLTQVSTLAALRLIVKASLSSNIMDSSTKWRANIGWDYVQALAKSLRFEIQDYLAE